MSLLLLFGGSVEEVTGTVAETLDAVTSAAEGSSVTGALAETLEDTTSAADGASGASGTLAETLEDATSAASGSSVTGSVAETLADVTSEAEGEVDEPPVTGTLAETLDDVTSAAEGSSVTGSLAETLDNATSAAEGTQGVEGTLAVTLGDVTSAAAGTQGVDGTVDVTLDDITAASEGFYGGDSLAVTLDDITVVATGTFTAIVEGDPSPVKCVMRKQRFSRKFRYHRHAERPAIQAWALDARNDLINFSDASYTFILRIGNPGSANYVEKTSNITGAVGSGVMRNGTPNLTIAWEPGELDIDPGVYTCELVASSAMLDVVFHGHIQILDRIL